MLNLVITNICNYSSEYFDISGPMLFFKTRSHLMLLLYQNHHLEGTQLKKTMSLAHKDALAQGKMPANQPKTDSTVLFHLDGTCAG